MDEYSGNRVAPLMSLPITSPGFESRQPAHVLMASYPYNPPENRYNFYPHSLRNMGEPEPLRPNADTSGSDFLKPTYFAFQTSCVPASCAPTERRSSTGWRSCRFSGGNCSAERRSRPIRSKYISPGGLSFHTSSCISVTLVTLVSQAIEIQNSWPHQIEK